MSSIICDIDGTIADASHRIHLIQTKPKNWKKFFSESAKDPVYQDVDMILNLMYEAGHDILFVTARPENERARTVKWLDENAGMKGKYQKLYMRTDSDFRDDHIVKKDILTEIRNDGFDPFLAFDDRDGVVNMWREQGISCFQVRSHV